MDPQNQGSTGVVIGHEDTFRNPVFQHPAQEGDLYSEPNETPVLLTKGELIRLVAHAMANANKTPIKSQGDINLWYSEAAQHIMRHKF